MTDLKETPKRIWVSRFIERKQDDVFKGRWDDILGRKDVEYIRKDVADARIADLKAEIKAALEDQQQ
ncbi:MAG: hypothetical protein ABJ360_22365 [Roseobacter sp.]